MIRIALIFILFSSYIFGLHAQEIQTKFGKNRVQYSDDFDTWFKYESDHFVTYWYGKSRQVAMTAIQFAEFDFDDIQSTLEHHLNEKIDLIVYGDLGELYQTNIGLAQGIPANTRGTRLYGNKLFVQFDGNHQHLREQIREGVAKVFVSAMLYGNRFKDMVQSSFTDGLPLWYNQGLIDYVRDPWTKEDDANLRYFIQDAKRPRKNFKQLSKQQPILAGKAFWYYIGTKYGKSTISNIVYLTRINNNIKSAFRYVLGETYDEVTQVCFDYFKERYATEVHEFPKPERKTAYRKNSNQAKFLKLTHSPDGAKIAYATNKDGRLAIYIEDIKTKKRKRIKRFGYQNNLREVDLNYPVLFWSTDNETLGLIYEFKNTLYLDFYNSKSKAWNKNTMNPIFNRVYAADFVDEKTLMINGNTNGFSDLYLYNLNTRIQQTLTDDLYDDLDATVVDLNGKQGILFSSNRTEEHITPRAVDSILVDQNFDLYFLDLTSKTIRALTATAQINERKPELRANAISYLSDASGIQAVVEQDLDEKGALLSPIRSKQFVSNIIDKSCSSEACMVSTNYNCRTMMHRLELDGGGLHATNYRKQVLEETATMKQSLATKNIDHVDSISSIAPGWFFKTKYTDYIPTNKTKNPTAASKDQDASKVHRFKANQMTAARLRFKRGVLSTSFDNEPLFSGLNSYAGNKKTYQASPMGYLLKTKIEDSFEDYVFELGVRPSLNFSSLEAFVSFENRKHRWDHLYGLYFQARTNRITDKLGLFKKQQQRTNLAYYKIKYPFDEFQALELGTILRNDQVYETVINEESYDFPTTNQQRIGLNLSYIYDNSSQRSINILQGVRAKLSTEFMNRFQIQLAQPRSFKPSEAYLLNVSADLRYYLPIFQKSILAARISTGTNIGSEQILYYVGGVEQSILSGFDQSTGVPEKNFAYTNIAPQLRGFDRNIRNGTSYLLGSVELRIPVFRHLFSDQLRYDFIREFQLVGFADMGTAWHGASPYSAENPINRGEFTNGANIKLNIQYFRDPLVLGFGYGIRTMLFGYFIKLDVARGIETKTILPTKFHVSVGTDF